MVIKQAHNPEARRKRNVPVRPRTKSEYDPD